jgi:hypothetical protein
MGLMEDIILRDSIEIQTRPEKVFNFLIHLVDDESYRIWHPEDHVALRWIKGNPWEEGSVARAEEYIHGKLHKLRFKITKVVPNKKIEYVPVSRFLRRFFPKNEFVIEQKGESCLFIASGTYRVGWLAKTFFNKAVDRALSSVKKHMKEEGENLKNILEASTEVLG